MIDFSGLNDGGKTTIRLDDSKIHSLGKETSKIFSAAKIRLNFQLNFEKFEEVEPLIDKIISKYSNVAFVNVNLKLVHRRQK